MALFFDHDWFDGRLSALGLTRDSLAMSAGMSPDEVDMLFDDRREISVQEINAFADLLSVGPHIIAKHCGIADLELEVARERVSGIAQPSQDVLVSREALMGLHERIDRLERLLEMVLTGLETRR